MKELEANNDMIHIDYALVEETRPAMYRAMKYWGKKPHNIWSDYIEKYCPKGGVVLDPFVGSGITAFEGAILGRKVYSFDLNPLSAFFIDVLTSKFSEEKFINSYNKITKKVNEDLVYQEHYHKKIDEQNVIIYNYKWENDNVVSISYKDNEGEGFSVEPEKADFERALKMESIKINYWFPTQEFPNNPSISLKFLKDIGGNSFQHLWTRRNLYILSLLFNEILKEENKDVQLQLLYGFIQTLHLTSKMVYPRSEKGNRDFSGSWGRADYMIRNKQMEQNPLIIFERSCIGKQSVVKSLMNSKERLPIDLKTHDISLNNKVKKNADINYGVLDIADLSEVVPEKSVDFIITDPPYGGLIQYLDLSLVWLTWLQKIDSKYIPDSQSEITVKKGITAREDYSRKLNNAFKQLHRVLKDDGYIVFTFHHNKIKEWNDFVRAVKMAGFKFDKVTHQYNKRSGESNVANPYGVSGADFYIRCVKQRDIDFTNDIAGFEHFVVEKTIEIISKRNEKTPFTNIVAGLMPEMLQAGYMYENGDEEIEKILLKHTGNGNIFQKEINTINKAGDYWWFNNHKEYIKYPDLPLHERVDETVLSLLRRRVAVKYDDVIGEVFKRYPNGLTPDIKTISGTLEKYAYQSSGKWKISQSTVRLSTIHTEVIRALTIAAKKGKYKVFVGKREQPEICEDGKLLKEFTDFHDLNILMPIYEESRIERIEMIDTIWLSGGSNVEVEAVFEVENSTGFTSAIQRASNLETEIPKFMIIPKSREEELLRTRDPLFVESFKENNWKYLFYEDVHRLSKSGNLDLADVIKISKEI